MIKGSKQRPNEGHLLDQTGKKRAFGGILNRHYAIDKRGAPGVDGDVRYDGCPTRIGGEPYVHGDNEVSDGKSAHLGGINRGWGCQQNSLCSCVDREANAVHPGRFLTGYHDDIGAFTDAFPGD
jgi:hypothetical protein